MDTSTAKIMIPNLDECIVLLQQVVDGDISASDIQDGDIAAILTYLQKYGKIVANVNDFA